MKALIISAVIALFATSCGSMQAPAATQTVLGAATAATDAAGPEGQHDGVPPDAPGGK